MECYESVSMEPGVDPNKLTGMVYENISDDEEIETKPFPMIKIEETELSCSSVALNYGTEEANPLPLSYLNTNMAAPASFHNLADVPVHIAKKESDWDLSDTNTEKTLDICQNILPNMSDVDSANECSISLQNVCLTQSPSSSLSEEVASPAIKLYREYKSSPRKKHRRKSKTHARITPKKSKKKRVQEPFVFEYANDEETYSLESDNVLDIANAAKTGESAVDIAANIVERNCHILGAKSMSLRTPLESSKSQSTLPFEIAPSRKRGRPRKKPFTAQEQSSASEEYEDSCRKINEQEQQQIIGFRIADVGSSETAGAVIVSSPLVCNSTVPPKKRKMEIKSALKQPKVEEDISFSGDEIEVSSSSSPTKPPCARGRPKKSKKKKKSPRKRLAHRIGRPPVLGNFKCDRCDLVFRERPKLIQHRKKHVRPFIYCSYCDFRARSRESFMEHESKHTKAKPFKCELCPYASRSRIDLQRHQAKHSKVKNYKCPYCDFTTKWRRNVSGHLLSHVDDRPFHCEICGQSFKRSCDLKYHLYRHTSEKPLQCEECEFRCKTKYELNLHKFKHSDVRSFPCTHPGCTQACKTKSDLAKHMHVHSEERNYPCPLCGKYFKSPSARNKHAQRHTNERPFKCDICNKGFKVKSSLGKHRQLHSGIRPFSCDVCDRTFSNKSNKEVHMRTHDTTNRPYRCPLCPYGGKSQQNLLAHVGTMHGNYAFFCELCKRPYKRHSQLQLHYKRMHTKKELEKLNSLDSLDMTLIKGEEDEAPDTSQDEGISEDQSGINHILKQIKQESSVDEESTADASPIDIPGLKMELTSTVEEKQNQPFPKKRKRGRPKKRKPPKRKTEPPQPEHLGDKHVKYIGEPSHKQQKRSNNQQESGKTADKNERSSIGKEIADCITVDKPATLEEQPKPCPVKRKRGRPRKRVVFNFNSVKKSSNKQNVDCGNTDDSENKEQQTVEKELPVQEHQSDKHIKCVNDTDHNELKKTDNHQHKQKGHTADERQCSPSAVGGQSKPLVDESQIGLSLDDGPSGKSTDTNQIKLSIRSSKRLHSKDIRKSNQSADNYQIEQSIGDEYISRSADNIQSDHPSDNSHLVDNSQCEHLVDNSPRKHSIDKSGSGPSAENNQCEHSPDNSQSQQLIVKSQSIPSVDKCPSEHSVDITQHGQCIGNSEGEYSKDKGQNKHSTVISQNEHSTVVSQSEHSTAIGQSEHSTDKSQSEHSTVISQGEHSTGKSQSEHSTVISQSEYSLVVSQNEHPTDKSQNEHLTDRSQSEHLTNKSQIEHLTDKRQSEHLTDKRQSEHLTDKRQSEHLTDKRQSEHTTDKSKSEHFTVISQSEHSTNKSKNEHSTDKSKSEHFTVISQGEHSTGKSKNDHSIDKNPNDNSTVISQSDHITDKRKSEQSIDNDQTLSSVDDRQSEGLAAEDMRDNSTEDGKNDSISSTSNGQCVDSSSSGHSEDREIVGHIARGHSSVERCIRRYSSRIDSGVNGSPCGHVQYTVDNKPNEHGENHTEILVDEDDAQISHQEMDKETHFIHNETHGNVVDRQSSSHDLSMDENPTNGENNTILYDLYSVNDTASHRNQNAKKTNVRGEFEEIRLKTAPAEDGNLEQKRDGSNRLPGTMVDSAHNTCRREGVSNRHQANSSRDDCVSVNIKDTDELSHSTEDKDQDELQKYVEEDDHQADNSDPTAEKHGNKQNFSIENSDDTLVGSCSLSRNASNTGPSDSSEICHPQESCGKVDENCEIGSQRTIVKPSEGQEAEKQLMQKNQTSVNTTNSNSTWTKFDDNFRLPLATKGFHFNFRKTGKKPKCWFMDLDVMDEESKNRQLQYLRRKARMVSIGKIQEKKRQARMSGHRKRHKLTSEDRLKGNKNTYKSFRKHRKESTLTSITKNPVSEQGGAHRHYTSRLDGKKVSKEDLFKLNKSEGTMLKPKLSIVSNEVSESCMQKVKGISLTSRRLPFKKKYIKLELDSEGHCVKPEENYPIEDMTDTTVPDERTTDPKKSVPKNETNQGNKFKDLEANHTEVNKNVLRENEGTHQELNEEPSTAEQVLEADANKHDRRKLNSIKTKAVNKKKAMEFDDSAVKRGRGRPPMTGVRIKTGGSVKLKLQEKIKQRQVEPKSRAAALSLTTDGEVMNNSGYDGTLTRKRKEVTSKRKSRQCLVCMRDMLYGKGSLDEYPENMTCHFCELDKCSSAEFEANSSKNIYEKIDLGSDSEESEDGELFTKNVYVVKPPVDKAVIQPSVPRYSRGSYSNDSLNIGNVRTYVVSKEMNKEVSYELTDVKMNVVNNVTSNVAETLSEAHGTSENQLYQSKPATSDDSNTSVIKLIYCKGSFESEEPVDIKPDQESLDFFQVQINNHEDTGKSVEVMEGVNSKVVFHQYPIQVTNTCVSDNLVQASSEQTINSPEENGNLYYSYVSTGALDEVNSNNNNMRILDNPVCPVNVNISKEDICGGEGSEQHPTDTKLYVYCDDVAAMRSGTGNDNQDENAKALWSDPYVKTVVEDLGSDTRLINGQTENVTAENYLGCKVKVEKEDISNELPDLVDGPVIQSSYNNKTYATADVSTDIKPLPVYHLSETALKYHAEQDQGLELNSVSDSTSIPGQDPSSCLPVILDVRSIKEEPDFDGV
ncbi:uncharacterized protein LOC117337238 [Pecten maximus]|uniref:uncharacterized protein LOC117337238 n=1 Tax=Pecten maximus TaxID=6579 RepID=UPI00145857F0|nr:uncharacterized protein LOC117337238 [Pecten maximus]